MKSVIENIKIKPDETIRIDCPECSGKGTLTITYKSGAVLYNCFKASCYVSGVINRDYDIGYIKRKLSGQGPDAPSKWKRPLPDMTSCPSHHPSVLKYLEDNNALYAFTERLIQIRYDPKANRCLFYMNNNTGAVGRHLNGHKPKWMAYGDVTGILPVGKSDHGIVVEDAASACAVGATGVYTGIALLGTNLNTKQKSQLLSFNKLTICLDKDASRKSLVLLRQLQGLVPCSVKFLNQDLKCYNSSEIVRVIT
jgi:hypothetical protein